MGVVRSLKQVALGEKEVEGGEVDHVPALPHHHTKVLKSNLADHTD